MRTGYRTALVGVTAAMLIGAAGGVQAARERIFPAPPPVPDALYLTSGAAVARLTLGYRALAADLYWIRAIQYYGRTRMAVTEPARAAAVAMAQSSGGYELLYPLLDVTTTLDPHFNIAYRFGAIFLADAFPAGAGRPDLAIALLEKGLRARPEKWEYMQDIGFVHYWWRQDYPAAAEWFERASDVPGAPWWLRSHAAVTLAEGGDRASSRRMWEAIYESADNDWLRQDAERRLTQLRAADEIDALQILVDRAAEALGDRPRDWAPLVGPGRLPGVPLDPRGTPYTIDAGRVRLSSQSPLFPLPDEPRRLSTSREPAR
jgi:tetratricopeptide (TPR) repeat protein